MTNYVVDRVQCCDCGLIRAMEHLEWNYHRKMYACVDRMACQAEPVAMPPPSPKAAAPGSLEEAFARAAAEVDKQPMECTCGRVGWSPEHHPIWCPAALMEKTK